MTILTVKFSRIVSCFFFLVVPTTVGFEDIVLTQLEGVGQS